MVHPHCAVCVGVRVQGGWMGRVRWDWGGADGDTTGGGDVFVKEGEEIQRFDLCGGVGQVWAVSLNQCTHSHLNKARAPTNGKE